MQNETREKQRREAFEAIYYKYYRPLYFFAHEILTDVQEAQDVVADVFMRLYQSENLQQETGRLKPYLYASVRNGALNVLRRRKTHSAKSGEIALGILEDEKHFADKMIVTELVQLIWKEMQSLPQTQREVFNLAYFEDKTTEEICALLKLDAPAVYNNKKRALDKLRVRFKNSDLTRFLFFLFFVG